VVGISRRSSPATTNSRFVGFPYAPGDPNTSALDTYFARIPLKLMRGPKAK
jgi:hypothetical protein